jgi:hypothetical protein
MDLVMKFPLNILRCPTALRIFALVMFFISGAASLAVSYALTHAIQRISSEYK